MIFLVAFVIFAIALLLIFIAGALALFDFDMYELVPVLYILFGILVCSGLTMLVSLPVYLYAS